MDHRFPQYVGAFLEAIQGKFESGNPAAPWEGNRLQVEGEFGPVEIVVEPPAQPSLDETPLEAVVRVRATVDDLAGLDDPVSLMMLHHNAALASLRAEGAVVRAESRLTLHAAPKPWVHYRPLIQASAFLGACAFAGPRLPDEFAADPWEGADFLQVRDFVGNRFLCNADESGLALEVPLRPGPPAAVLGNRSTALVQMNGRERHPRVGAGLHVLLQLPHGIPDRERLAEVVRGLNDWELQGADLPPHFGAWCEGPVGNPCYTMFLPSRLRRERLAWNLAVWMVARARLADGLLLAMDIPTDLGSERFERQVH